MLTICIGCNNAQIYDNISRKASVAHKNILLPIIARKNSYCDVFSTQYLHLYLLKTRVFRTIKIFMHSLRLISCAAVSCCSLAYYDVSRHNVQRLSHRNTTYTTLCRTYLPRQRGTLGFRKWHFSPAKVAFLPRQSATFAKMGCYGWGQAQKKCGNRDFEISISAFSFVTLFYCDDNICIAAPPCPIMLFLYGIWCYKRKRQEASLAKGKATCLLYL